MMLNFGKENLIPVLCQDARSQEMLMLGYMDPEALRRTVRDGQVWFYSRSRKELWHKGETSGSFLSLRSITADCDGDALLLQVEPTGPVCHTGAQSCFFQPLTKEAAEGETAGLPAGPHQPILEELWEVIQERNRSRPAGSYVASLLEAGVPRAAQKVVEEAGEAAVAAASGEAPERVAAEVADLWFHTLVLLAAAGLTPEHVWQELRRRRR